MLNMFYLWGESCYKLSLYWYTICTYDYDPYDVWVNSVECIFIYKAEKYKALLTDWQTYIHTVLGTTPPKETQWDAEKEPLNTHQEFV